MKFATADLGKVLRTELRLASEASIAVAYFNPDDTILSALTRLPSLKLVISADFQVNDPYKLESLARRGTLRAVPADANAGKLHSKVFLIHRKDGTRWAMVGSANLTRPGLFCNQEACVILDSAQPADVPHLNDIEAWFKRVLNEPNQKIDFGVAKRIFDTRKKYRLLPPDSAATRSDKPVDSRRYWVLKTTEGVHGEAHWEDFLAEDIIAIGWCDIGVDPSVVRGEALEKAIRRAYPDGKDVKRAAKKLGWFVDMDSGDLVLICQGFSPNQRKPVHIYGIARVEGRFRNDAKSRWWRFKHKAVIQPIGEHVPRDIIAGALNKGSLLEAIHKLKPKEYAAFVNALRDEFGITISV